MGDYPYLLVTNKLNCFLTANSLANAGDTIGNAMDSFIQSIVSKWGIAAAFICYLLVASLVFRILPSSDASAKISPDRIDGIEGFRGLLAFCVFFAHCLDTHYTFARLNNGMTALTFGPIGIIGVGFFFLLTGYLFWAKLLCAPDTNFERLFRGRVARIAPGLISTYALCTLLLFIVDAEWGHQLKSPS